MEETLDEIQVILARMEEHNNKTFEQMMQMLETVQRNIANNK